MSRIDLVTIPRHVNGGVRSLPAIAISASSHSRSRLENTTGASGGGLGTCPSFLAPCDQGAFLLTLHTLCIPCVNAFVLDSFA